MRKSPNPRLILVTDSLTLFEGIIIDHKFYNIVVHQLDHVQQHKNSSLHNSSLFLIHLSTDFCLSVKWNQQPRLTVTLLIS